MRIHTMVIFILGFLMVTASVFGQCQNRCGASENECASIHENDAKNIGGKTVQIDVPTIQCETCKDTIEKGLLSIEGISAASVDIDKKVTTVNFDPAKMDISKIEKAISALGYQANEIAADNAAFNKLADCCKVHKKVLRYILS